MYMYILYINEILTNLMMSRWAFETFGILLLLLFLYSDCIIYNYLEIIYIRN